MENFEEQDDTLSISENLDENGFPSEEKKENGVFASDFYGSGTDWSSLVIDSNKKLKQSNLFQMWGINNKPSSSEHQSSNLKQSNLFQIWGINKKKPSSIPCASDSSKNETLIQGSGMKRKGNEGRACPFYKKIPGTPFSVDAFRYGLIEGCSAYFLSHFHYDHYGGLSKGWSHGPIYCTPVTARLVKMCLSVNPSFICPLELNVEHNIKGVRVTMLEANHCPGAALIHFRLIDGRCYLHTGDFRASKSMQSYPLLASRRINLLYLDTTYCNPKYRFPSKEDVLAFVVKIAKQSLEKQPKTLIIVGAFSIGKECVYLAISEALQIKIHTNASRRRVLESFGWQELTKKLSSHGHDTPLHVLPLSTLRHENLKKYVETYGSRYTAVLAFRPTGWTYSETSGNELDLIRPNCRGNITIYGVPYSEHSSFLEMREFVQFLKPDKIIPTVNVGNADNRDKMQSYFREWMK